MQTPSPLERSPGRDIQSDDDADAHDDTVRTIPSEELFLRNYDPYRQYEATVTVTGEADEPRFRETFRLRPGQVESVRGVIEPGEYDVTVQLDTLHTEETVCRVDSSAGHTIHVEIGNGIASVTEGLYA